MGPVNQKIHMFSNEPGLFSDQSLSGHNLFSELTLHLHQTLQPQRADQERLIAQLSTSIWWFACCLRPVGWRRCFCGQMGKLHISTLGSSNPTSHMEVFLGDLHGFTGLKHDCQDNATSTGATNFQTSGGEVVTDRQLFHFRVNHNPTTSQPSTPPSSLRGVGNHHSHHHHHQLHPSSTSTSTPYLLSC